MLELILKLTNLFCDLISAVYYLFACFSMFNSMLMKALSLQRFIMSKRPFCCETCVLLQLIWSEPSLERIQTVGHKNVSLNYAMHLFYTDQVDEYTLVEHKSALSILVAPHPASCWPNTKCWMSSHLPKKHCERPDIRPVWPRFLTLSVSRLLLLMLECLVFTGCPVRKFLIHKDCDWWCSVLVWPAVPEPGRLAGSEPDGAVDRIPAPLRLSNTPCVTFANPTFFGCENDSVTVTQSDPGCSFFVQTVEYVFPQCLPI